MSRTGYSKTLFPWDRKVQVETCDCGHVCISQIVSK